ncbi:MAG: hypothetical protein AMXMBFR82_02390 [Candidatus Hydrogenedentota bacterium]
MLWTPDESQQQFIRRYAKSVETGDVALFAGAGLSRSAGFVDWKALLSDIAKDLKLDINREHDLIAVAQYHVNEKQNRSRINQAIIDELSEGAELTRSHAILARLPFASVWTTNYDQLLEKSFEEAGKTVDLKITQENLAQSRRGRDVIVYKMHGCVTQPQDAVITKDDYEQYEQRRQLFVESLKGDLISKTFLFLGFSFTDPNIDYILSRVRVLLGKNQREHFCIMRKPQCPPKLDGQLKSDYEYELRKTQLREQDLHRFGINTVFVDDFAHITDIIESLASFIHRKTVFVSGAAHDYGPLGRDRIEGLVRCIGSRLISDGYNLVSGFGYGIGEQCVVGALRALFAVSKGGERDRVTVRPFPGTKGSGHAQQNKAHREDLIARSGVVVVLCGNGEGLDGKTQESAGVFEEVDIAIREKKVVIPIGATGHAADTIWNRAKESPRKYLQSVEPGKEFDVLGNVGASNDEILEALSTLLQRAEKSVTF